MTDLAEEKKITALHVFVEVAICNVSCVHAQIQVLILSLMNM